MNSIQLSNEVFFTSMTQSKAKDKLAKAEKSYGHTLDYGRTLLSIYTPILMNKFEELDKDKSATRKKMWKAVFKGNNDRWEEAAYSLSVSIISCIAVCPKVHNVVSSAYKAVMLTLGYDWTYIAEHSAEHKSFILYLYEYLGRVSESYEFRAEDGRSNYIVLMPPFYELVKKTETDTILDAKVFTPMVEKPKRHYDLVSSEGGYFSFASPLLKRPTKIDGEIHPAILNFNYKTQPEFFDTVNKVQETPFCINTLLLEAIKTCYDQGFEWKEFPLNKDLHLDVISENCDKTVKALEKRGIEITDKLVKHVYKREENKLVASIMKTNTTIKQATDYSYFSEIYFPVYFDSRGRRYTYAYDTLSYLGTSLSKPLIHFANKERLTITGVKNMFAALGNSLGYDKKSISLKTSMALTWWKEHKIAIMNSDYSCFFTEEMDEPINALAICLELVKFKTDKTWKTGFPFHLDARCSGISIIGTLLHDLSSMVLTSVVDVVKNKKDNLPDAYGTVAKNAADNASSDLQKYEGLFSRGMFKKPVMTLAYGAGSSTRSNESKSRIADLELDMEDEEIKEFNKLMEEALKNVSPSCTAYLKACKTMARRHLLTHDHLYYDAPMTGFPCVDKQYIEEVSEISIRSDRGTRITLNNKTFTDEIDVNAMVRWLSPSLIHSCDAAVLSNISSSATFDICTIHDSFASHPNHSQKLVKLYAEQMKKLMDGKYLDAVFKQFSDEITPPYANTFTDSNEILNSLHIIC